MPARLTPFQGLSSKDLGFPSFDVDYFPMSKFSVLSLGPGYRIVVESRTGNVRVVSDTCTKSFNVSHELTCTPYLTALNIEFLKKAALRRNQPDSDVVSSQVGNLFLNRQQTQARHEHQKAIANDGKMAHMKSEHLRTRVSQVKDSTSRLLVALSTNKYPTAYRLIARALKPPESQRRHHVRLFYFKCSHSSWNVRFVQRVLSEHSICWKRP